jgi:hypothetical protein
MVKTGSINMAKAIRRIGHRSGQARKMTFVRDAITGKDNYGGEITDIATGNEGLTIPNIDAFIAPIITKTDTFNKGGHLVTGSAILYVPSLETIKNNVLGIDSTGAHNSRLSSFNELESKDKLYDMEKIIYSADSGTDASLTETYTITANMAGFEVDRLQFKVTDDDGTNRITSVVIKDDTGSETLTWTFDSNINFDNNKYHMIDLPISNVDAGDKAYCVYVPSSGASGIRTATASIANSFNIADMDGEDSYLSTVVITSNASGMTTKDFRLYKAGEWNIKNIKEYRDEYMELGCDKIRGERGSRRRATVINAEDTSVGPFPAEDAY